MECLPEDLSSPKISGYIIIAGQVPESSVWQIAASQPPAGVGTLTLTSSIREASIVAAGCHHANTLAVCAKVEKSLRETVGRPPLLRRNALPVTASM